MRGSLLPPVLVLGLMWGGCASESDSIDQFPIPVDRSTGAILAPVRTGSDQAPFWAVVDTLAPLSVVDSAAGGLEPRSPRRRLLDLTLLAANDTGDGVPRAQFGGAIVLDLHPCGAAGACPVGSEAASRPIGGIVGADLLSRYAVRFAFADQEIRFFPRISGDERARLRACEAVFDTPFYGGGTVLVGGGEVSYPGLRLAVSACTDYAATEPSAANRGVNMLLLVSTGLGTTLLSESAYQRYRTFYRDDPSPPPPSSELPSGSVILPSGPLQGRLTSVRRLALVAEGSRNRGPCTELYANHVMSNDACRQPRADIPVEQCPCTGSQFCSTAAAVEIDRPIDVLVVSDQEPLLQALRDELRPALPELDGILGTDALTEVGLDVDYPNGRIILRCLDDGACTARPAVVGAGVLADLQRCPGI